MLKSRKKGEGNDVDLTPMIDVVFQLIIFFMVALSLAVVYGVVIKFPQQLTPPKKQKVKPKIISVYIHQDWITTGHDVIQDGDIKILGDVVQLWVSGNKATKDKEREAGFKYLKDQMNYLIKTKGFKKSSIVIKGDIKTYHWKLIKVIDIAKECGIKGFSMVPPFK